jgi:DHA1 family multidrug resistance protein-like MFS transporter
MQHRYLRSMTLLEAPLRQVVFVFAGPMFKSLGVSGGVTLLGGLTVGCTAGLVFLYFYGAELRKRSKFAVK